MEHQGLPDGVTAWTPRVDLVQHDVEAERRRIGALLRREIDVYEKDHDENGFEYGIESITGVLEEGGDPAATTAADEPSAEQPL